MIRFLAGFLIGISFKKIWWLAGGWNIWGGEQ